MDSSQRIAISLPSSLAHLDLAQMIAERIAKAIGLDEDGQLDFGLAIREVAINAMKHGNGFDESTPVHIEFHTRETSVRAQIVDQGAGFDPEQTPDPTSGENVWRSSGRGLLLIRTLVDDIQFDRLPDGMQVSLTKSSSSAG